MIKFGPSGLSDEYRAMDIPVYKVAPFIREQGLDCFEYSFGKGVRLSDSTANLIGSSFKEQNVELSVHAPYFINLATEEDDKAEKNVGYIFDSITMLNKFGGNRCVFHPGSQMRRPRDEAFNVLLKNFEKICEIKDSNSEYKDVLLCPETMGKLAQLGDLEEIIVMCKFLDSIVPCIDFGHLNSRMLGAIKAKDDYKRIIDRLIDTIGEKKTSNMHVHFSKIQYTDKGEFKHLTFDDNVYGPDFEPLMEVFKDYNMSPYIVCESAGTQTRDILMMKNYYNMYKN